MFILKNQKGMSLIEILVSAAVMITISTALMSLISAQNRQINAMEFNTQKAQLRLSILSGVLSDPKNCKCMFKGAQQFRKAGTDELKGTMPTSLSRYKFDPSAPGDCSRATEVMSYAEIDVPKNGVTPRSIKLLDITEVDGTKASGNLQVVVESAKPMGDNNQRILEFPVDIDVTVAGYGRHYVGGCSLKPPDDEDSSGGTSNSKLLMPHSCRILANPGTYRGEHKLSCNTDEVVKGISVTGTRTLSDSLKMTCCKVEGLNWSTVAPPVTVTDGKTYNADNTEHSGFCPANHFMTGLSIYKTESLDGQIKVECRTSSLSLSKVMNGKAAYSSNETISKMSRFRSGGFISSYTYTTVDHIAECPGNGIMSGIGFWSSKYLTNITRMECSD